MIRFAQEPVHRARITVIGVGGAGGNAVNRMVSSELYGVDFVAANTDMQALSYCQAREGIQIGPNLTQGLGSGGNPDIGRRAAEEDRDSIREALEGADMVFITAGMGGGTGTGAAPVVAEVAKDLGALTVGVVTRPFDFEGPVRRRRAEEGVSNLKEKVDTLIVIPNQRLLSLVEPDTPLDQAFLVADEVLLKATRGICELITRPGLVNLDFADVRSIMAEMGDAIMGSGSAQGEGRAIEAAEQAVSCPLLEDVSITGAQGLLVNVTGGHNMSLHEVSAAVSVVNDASGGEANLIFGAVLDENANEELRVTVIATGIGEASKAAPAEAPVAAAEPVTVDIRNYRSDDLLRPAFRRREERIDDPATVVSKGQVRVLADDDLETPAFLRRRID